MEKIGIFCSASDNIDKMYFESASQIGKWMGQTGKTLIYGGASLGSVSYTHLDVYKRQPINC